MRPSDATFVDVDGVLRVVPADIPRERDLAGRAARLIEGAGANVVQHADSQTVGWGTSTGAVSEDVAVAPDGTMTADRVTLTPGSYGPYQAASTAAEPLTLSLWIQAAAGTSGFRARFSYEAAGYGPSLRIAGTAASTWTRVSHTAAPAFAPRDYVLLESRAMLPSRTDPPIAQDVNVWGWQLEAREFPTSFIPTAAAVGTRAADLWEVASPDLSVDFSTARAQLLIAPEWATGDRRDPAWVFTCGDADGIRIAPSGAFEVVIAGSIVAATEPVVVSAGTIIEVLWDPAGGTLSIEVDGASRAMIAGAPWTWPGDRIRLGSASSPGSELYGWITLPARP